MTAEPDTVLQGSPLGLVAADGQLPELMAKEALGRGIDLVVFVFSKERAAAFRSIAGPNRVVMAPFKLAFSSFELLHDRDIKQVVFAGTLNRWLLLKNIPMDARAQKIWNGLSFRRVDELMLAFIGTFEEQGVSVLPQTVLAGPAMARPGIESRRTPSTMEREAVQLGLQAARGIAELGIGQSVIVSGGMVVGAEAVEGTDGLIRRCRRWTRRNGGVLVKTMKPGQDLRYDIPVVGPRTLRNMKSAGIDVLAVEQGKTIVLEMDAMRAYCDQHNLCLAVVEG